MQQGLRAAPLAQQPPLPSGVQAQSLQALVGAVAEAVAALQQVALQASFLRTPSSHTLQQRLLAHLGLQALAQAQPTPQEPQELPLLGLVAAVARRAAASHAALQSSVRLAQEPMAEVEQAAHAPSGILLEP
jgi:hypothetical protein